MSKIKEYIEKRKNAKKYIAEFSSDKRDQRNYLKLWASSGMPDIKTSGPHQGGFNIKRNTLMFGNERYREKDNYGSYSSKEDEKKKKAHVFVEELAHARQYKSMHSPFRPLNTNEKWIDDVYKFDPFNKYNKQDPLNVGANVWGGGLYVAGHFLEMLNKGVKYNGKEESFDDVKKVGKDTYLIGHLASLLGNKLGKYKTIKEERAKSNLFLESFNNADRHLNIKSVLSDPDYLKSMKGWERQAYKEGKMSNHSDHYDSPWTIESMAHTQLDPREGHERDNYTGEKDTRSISDMIRGEYDILSAGDDNYLNRAFKNFKWLVDHTKNTIKVNEVMGKKWEKDYNKDISSFVGEALRYE
tara:strand:+ start:3223 stop:4290 length:1068 start_codon:yes stop_codon:yes gene_type:complete